MDYSNRVNSKKGSGGVADAHETNVHTRRRLKELLTTQVLDLENDPYVFRNQLGLLECRLCLTTHVSESSYISHLGGKKHQLNLEKRRILDKKFNQRNQPQNRNILSNDGSVVSISNTPVRNWTKIGTPAYKVTKIRDATSLATGVLIKIEYPQLVRSQEEPIFRLMSYYEFTNKNQNKMVSYLDQQKKGEDPNLFQYLIISAEPYENICIALPNKEIDNSNAEGEMSDTYWWYYDRDTKEYFIQLLFKKD